MAREQRSGGAPVAAGKKLRPGSGRSRAAGSAGRRRPGCDWPAAVAQGGGDGGPGRRGAGAAICGGRRGQFAGGGRLTDGGRSWAAGAGGTAAASGKGRRGRRRGPQGPD
ncbi:H/ACA ribonucleoprotein complex subunit GAR1-like [Cryptomeria japonica]|uniref:H/ACA ribonucleoprotein complex subunit GAR1-like n=1 Tax=Cryptomeria japonica TaxID=3369 RepID=UPI0027DA8CC4|nr:H/ACA ribonucleoprotein complex subunit GAR1-like [Cryptomeria japonica]